MLNLKPSFSELREGVTLQTETKILFAEICLDGDAENPCDMRDGNGKILDFRNPKDRKEFERLNESKTEMVPLSRYSHRGDHWSLMGKGIQCRWDTTTFAGVWVPVGLAYIYKDLHGQERISKLEELAKGVLETYNQWVNGEVYGFSIECYKLKKDEDGNLLTEKSYYENHQKPTYEDSCWGFYGETDILEEVHENIAYGLKEETSC